MYHIALALDSILCKTDTITPVLEDKHTGVYGCCTGSRNIGKVINCLLYCCIGVEITAILYADALQIVLQRVALEMVGTIEGKVLQEVSQTALVIILIDRTHFLCDVETGYMLRITVVTNVVSQSIIKTTYLHILVYRNSWHLLCHRCTCRKEQHNCCKNLS